MFTVYTPTLVQTQHQLHVHNTDTINQYTYKISEITQITRIQYNHPSKRGNPEKARTLA